MPESIEPFHSSIASRFQKAGYTCLVYNNRNWYTSEGKPRNETDPLLQTRDYTSAINYALSLPSVDPKKIVLWGGSLSGGNAICAAAVDRRVKGVISLCPFVSGEHITLALGPMVNFILADNVAVTQGMESQLFPVNETVADVWGSDTGYADFLEEMVRLGVAWEDMATTQSMFHLQAHDPRAFSHRVTAPVLMIVAEKDCVVPVFAQKEMFERMGKQKQLYEVKGKRHFDIYYGDGLEEVLRVQLEFLGKTFP
jgi:pimeloyl-ACP methyl ester carboxylesterase